ncbi:MAG: MBL fold metallo-hydrolase [Candidatus Brocadiia bacterium]
MQIVFLGTNGWYDTNTGNTICTLINTEQFLIVLDAGNGIHKLGRYIDSNNPKPAYLFLSHFHLDHIEGMHTLAKLRFLKKLTILSSVGAKSALGRIIKSPYTIDFSKLPFKVDIFELPKDRPRLPFKISVSRLKHSDMTIGCRIETDSRVISYCPDTGYCPNAVKIAKNADILITECAFRSGQVNPEWPHLNPESAAGIAKESKVAKLYLTHFDASVYTSLKDRKLAQSHAQKVFKQSFVAVDDKIITI